MPQKPEATRRLFSNLKEAVEAIQAKDVERIALVWNSLVGQLDLEIREPRHVQLAKKMISELQAQQRALASTKSRR